MKKRLLYIALIGCFAALALPAGAAPEFKLSNPMVVAAVDTAKAKLAVVAKADKKAKAATKVKKAKKAKGKKVVANKNANKK
jgi:hypothetical protein